LSNHDELSSKDPIPVEITVARVQKTQGRKGEVAAEILTDFPDRFEKSKCVRIVTGDGTGSWQVIEEAWFHKQYIILKFLGIDSITAAEALKGAEIRVPQSELRSLPPQHHYIFDLIACRVVDDVSGQEIGHVRDFSEFGGNQLLCVETAQGERLIPFVEPICCSIDTHQRIIRVRLPEGLLELNP
jgi:16S rRNA processing protein RimM